MNKKYIIIGIIIVVVLVLVLIIIFSGGKTDSTNQPAPVSGTVGQQVADSPEQITNDLNGLDTGDISKEFQDIDSQIKSL